MKRLAASIFIDGPKAYTTREFKNFRYVGEPVNLVRVLNEMEADETEVVQRSFPDEDGLRLLAQISRQAFMPLTYTGGISSEGQAEQIARIGFEKIGVNSCVHDRPQVLDEIAKRLGASSTILGLTYREIDGVPMVVDWKTFEVKGSLEEVLLQHQNRQFGELKLTNISKDGTFTGADVRAIQTAITFTSAPITYAGGIGSVSDILAAWEVGASCVSIGSFLSLRSALKSPLILYPEISYAQRTHV